MKKIVVGGQIDKEEVKALVLKQEQQIIILVLVIQVAGEL